MKRPVYIYIYADCCFDENILQKLTPELFQRVSLVCPLPPSSSIRTPFPTRVKISQTVNIFLKGTFRVKEMNFGPLLLSDFTAEIICLLSTRRPRKRSLNRCSSTEGRKQKWGEGSRNYDVRQKTILAQYYVATLERVQHKNYEQTDVDHSRK